MLQHMIPQTWKYTERRFNKILLEAITSSARCSICGPQHCSWGVTKPAFAEYPATGMHAHSTSIGGHKGPPIGVNVEEKVDHDRDTLFASKHATCTIRLYIMVVQCPSRNQCLPQFVLSQKLCCACGLYLQNMQIRYRCRWRAEDDTAALGFRRSLISAGVISSWTSMQIQRQASKLQR